MNGSHSTKDTLTDEEILFYSRQLGIRSWGIPAQEKLKRSRVFVAGAGGLGSAVIYYLAAAGVGNIRVCDSDTIEPSNFNRQIIHRYERIGMRKADSAIASARELNPFINPVSIPKIIDKKKAEDLIGSSDLILDCLDNFETRLVLNQVSVKHNIPMIHAGIMDFQGQITFLHPPETPCLACFITKEHGKSADHIAGMTAGIVGSMQALEAVKYLTGIGPSLKNMIAHWDGVSMRLECISLKRNPDCRVCKNIKD